MDYGMEVCVRMRVCVCMCARGGSHGLKGRREEQSGRQQEVRRKWEMKCRKRRGMRRKWDITGRESREKVSHNCTVICFCGTHIMVTTIEIRKKEKGKINVGKKLHSGLQWWRKCADILHILLWSKMLFCKREKSTCIFNQFRAAMVMPFYSHLNGKLHGFTEHSFIHSLELYLSMSLSLSSSVHMPPSRHPMSVLWYQVISTHKSLQMHETSICDISNTVPDLFQSGISIPHHLPPVFDRPAFTLWQECFSFK